MRRRPRGTAGRGRSLLQQLHVSLSASLGSRASPYYYVERTSIYNTYLRLLLSLGRRGRAMAKSIHMIL